MSLDSIEDTFVLPLPICNLKNDKFIIPQSINNLWIDVGTSIHNLVIIV